MRLRALILIGISLLCKVGKKISLYFILIVIALVMLLPFYMMFVMSTLSTNEIYSFPPIMWFGDNLVTNFRNMGGGGKSAESIPETAVS